MDESGKLNGQWTGTYSGASSGSIIINIDERESSYSGGAYLTENDSAIPLTVASFSIVGKSQGFTGRTDWIITVDRGSGQAITLEDRAKKYPTLSFPASADIQGYLEKDTLKLSWTTNLGTSSQCVLVPSRADQPSDLTASEGTWETYKQHVAKDFHKRYLFRGQNEPWRLRTSFHRAGRADVIRYINEDIKALHRQLSARTKHIFNLTIGDENGAFFNLVQHHGYPTPLLDWTYSPYVAAFFAYRGITKDKARKAGAKDKARILVFDQAQWTKDFNQLPQIDCPGFHVSILQFIAIENERMIPQQAASMITNVDDIESYVISKETKDKKYLWAMDLPVVERRHVISELSYMGITAGSMFPGLDGACEELKERTFEV